MARVVCAAVSGLGATAEAALMFAATAPFSLFDYFRVPYVRDEAGQLELPGLRRVAAVGGDTALHWPSEALLDRDGGAGDLHFVRSIPIFGRIVREPGMRALARRTPGEWGPVDVVRNAAGTAVSAIWRTEDGGTLLPFAPDEVFTSFRTERYAELGRRARAARLTAAARQGYYAARPFMPRSVQMRLRRSFSRVQERARFPRWPAETALDDVYAYLFELVADLTSDAVPYIAPWPAPWSWALVLTHDVEQRVGYENVERLRAIELREGYRSSWNFVPRNGYVVAREALERLRADGFEIGVHGLRHDGRDVARRTLHRRLPAIRSYAEQWDAVGFRSPATLRSPRLIPLLGFDYDSSYSDTAPFEPQAGGCCTALPYMLGDTVELPITLPQDHTVFELLRLEDETIWVDKARLLRERGGMALALTHPDYVGNERIVHAYGRFLREFAEDETAWKALPREVSAWWRRRAASRLEMADGEWRVVGPAAGEARVATTSGERLRA